MDGFFVSLASLVGLIVGIYGAIHFSHFTAEFLMDKVSWNEQKINLLAFALTFLIIVILVHFTGKILTMVANFAALGLVNKLLGAFFGIFRSAFILSVIFLFLNELSIFTSFIDEETKEHAILYGPVEKLAPAVLPSILKEAREEDLIK